MIQDNIKSRCLRYPGGNIFDNRFERGDFRYNVWDSKS